MSGLRAWIKQALAIGRVKTGADWGRVLFDGNRL